MKKLIRNYVLYLTVAVAPVLAFNPPASSTEPNKEADNSERSTCNTSGKKGANNGCLSLRIPFGRLAHAPELSKGFLGLEFERASPLMHTPQGLAYRLYVFSSITNVSVKEATVVQANGGSITFRFAEGSSVGAPIKRETGFPNRLQRLDAANAPVTNAAVQTVCWFDHWYSDGSRIRLSAQTGKSVSVTTAEGRIITPETCGVTVVCDTAGTLQQVWSEADGLANVVVTAPGSAYEIRLYAPEAAGEPGTDGLRSVSGSPHTVWRISNPDAGSDSWSRLVAVEEKAGFSVTNEWRYMQSRDEWVMDQSWPAGRRVLHDSEKSEDGKNKTLTETTYWADGKTVAQKTVTRYSDYGWGLVSYEIVEDPQTLAMKKTIGYYRDPSQAGRYTKAKVVTYPDGSWEAYDYDSQGRVTLKVRPWLGQPASAVGQTAEQLATKGLAVRYSYTPVTESDVLGLVDTRPRKTETFMSGALVSRTYATYVRGGSDGALTETREVCTDLASAFGAPSNLRTIVAHFPTNQTDLARVKSVLSPDGILRTFSYAAGHWAGTLADGGTPVFTDNAAGAALRTTVTEGTDAAPDGIAGKTRQTVVYADKRGNAVLNKIAAKSGTSYTEIAWSAAAFDAFHNVTSRLDSAGYASSDTWTGSGQPIAATDTYGLSYLYGYDALGRLATEVRLPVGGIPAVTNVFTYDPVGRVIEAKVASDGASRQLLSAAYDRVGRPVSVTDVDGRAVSYAYADGGRTITATLSGGGTKIQAYWPGGTLRSVTGSAATPPMWFTYGVTNGTLWMRATAGSEGSAATVTRYVDPAGRAVSVRYADGLSESLAYDLAGRLTNALDRAGHVTRFGWDAAGYPLSVARQAEAGFATVSFGLDLPTLTESITNEAGALISRTVRDIAGRKVTDTDINNLDEVRRFAAGGRIAAISRRDGVLVSNVWDAAGRLAEVRHDGTPVLGFAWRADGLPLAASNAAAVLSWALDAHGLVTNATCAGSAGAPPAAAWRLSHVLNAAALPTDTAFGVGSWTFNVGRSFDADERLSAQTTPAGTFRLTYDAVHGLPASVSNSALSAAHAYDLLGRVTNMAYRNASGTTVGQFRYRYDASGFVTQKVGFVDGSAWTNAYTYDALGRLTSEKLNKSGASAVTAFSYDLAGNRLTAGASNFTYSNNRLNGVSHDSSGNITNMVRGGVTLGLSWNTLGQLTAVSTNDVFAESYAYDPLGRRVKTTTGGTSVYHVYDGTQCVADIDGAGNPLRSYTWGPGIDNLLALTVYGAGVTNSYYAVKDHLGSVQALVNASGAVMESYTYDAWGNTAILSSGLSPLTSSAYGNRFMFQGREYSAATGLYNFRARWYSPELGRWLSTDPIGLEGGLNLYEFCGNNPVCYRDPSGLIVVFVYDGNDEQLANVLRVASTRYDASYNMRDSPDLSGLRSYLEQLKANGESIEAVMFADHGVAGDNDTHYQEYGDSDLWLLPNAECDMSEIGKMMDPYVGRIVLLGCYVALDSGYHQKVARAFNKPTMAYSNLVRWLSDGTYFPRFDGERVRRNPFSRRWVSPAPTPLRNQ